MKVNVFRDRQVPAGQAMGEDGLKAVFDRSGITSVVFARDAQNIVHHYKVQGEQGPISQLERNLAGTGWKTEAEIEHSVQPAQPGFM